MSCSASHVASTVTINQKSGQVDPTSSSPVVFTAVFSEAIDVSTFTTGSLSTSGSTAPGIVIGSITQVAPSNGTTFDISVSTSGTGTIVLSMPTSNPTILGTTGRLPSGIATDSAGNIYTANYLSGTISKITPLGVSTTLATTG